MLLPKRDFFLGRFDHPLQAFNREIFQICTSFVANQDVKTRSGQSPPVKSRLKVLSPFKHICSSTYILINEFPLIAEGCVAPASVGRRVSCEDGMHVPPSPCLCPSLERLWKGVFLIGFRKHLPVRVAEHLSRVDTSEHEVWVPVDICEKVFPSSSVLESGGEKVVKLVIVGVKWVNFVVEVISKPIHFIFLLIKVVLPFLNTLKLSDMLLSLHNFYFQKKLKMPYKQIFSIKF